MILGERETRLLSACVAASVALHAAALVLAPRLRHAQLEPPQVLSVVLAELGAPEPARDEAAHPPPPPKPETPRARSRPAPPPQPRVADPAPAIAPAPTPPATETARPREELAPAPAASAPAMPTPTAPEWSSIVPPDYRAAYLNNPPPAYPRSARRNGEQGTVTLRVHVGADGVPAAVELERSSGSSALDAAALESVKSWRFVPARRGTDAVAAWVIVPVVFRLAPAP
jgi:protein TonB